jgi:hypothetical protein
MLVIWLAVYFYFAYSQYKIACRIGHQWPWWAFIPVLNLFQQVQLANKQWYWFILYLIPFVNIIALAAVWINIAQNCNKSAVWGIMAILPFLNFIAWGYLAFSRWEPSSRSVPEPTPREHEPVG